MAEETLWKFEPHTVAKHQILKAYISAWAPILLQGYNERVVYIDGFAGPGEDINGVEGSPTIALRTLIEHKFRERFKNIFMLFVELKSKRVEHLKTVLVSKFPTLPSSIKYEIVESDFNVELKGLLDNLHKEGSKLAPTFCFYDPFGWDVIDIDLLAEFMLENKAELFITFMVGFIDRFAKDTKSRESFSKIFNEEQLDRIGEAAGSDKEDVTLQFFVRNLEDALKAKGKGRRLYHISFAIVNSTNNISYYLIYFTFNTTGMRAMKDAMCSVARDGSYKFSDFDFEPNQSMIFDFIEEVTWVNQAADEIYQKFKGNKIKTGMLKNYIIAETNWPFRADILRHLEKQRKIRYLGNRRTRALTYADENAEIEFFNE